VSNFVYHVVYSTWTARKQYLQINVLDADVE